MRLTPGPCPIVLTDVHLHWQQLVFQGILMSLDQEIAAARKVIVSDGYDMSVGELMNLIAMANFASVLSINASSVGSQHKNRVSSNRFC